MESARLDKDMISQPELWKLVLMIGDERLEAGLFPPVAREEMIWRSYRFDPAAPSKLKALEDIIYDNPLLLCDFKQVDCIIDYTSQTLLPAGLDDTSAETLYRACTDTTDLPETYATGCSNAVVALSQEPDIRAFITRTFFNVKFDSRIAALCRYFTSEQSRIKGMRMYVPVRDRRLTVIALDGDRLLMANDFRFNSDMDAAYYILASMQQLGMDADNATVAVGSAGSVTDGLMDTLRIYLPEVRPLPFPMLRYRATKHTLQAPLDIIIRPICE